MAQSRVQAGLIALLALSGLTAAHSPVSFDSGARVEASLGSFSGSWILISGVADLEAGPVAVAASDTWSRTTGQQLWADVATYEVPFGPLGGLDLPNEFQRAGDVRWSGMDGNSSVYIVGGEVQVQLGRTAGRLLASGDACPRDYLTDEEKERELMPLGCSSRSPQVTYSSHQDPATAFKARIQGATLVVAHQIRTACGDGQSCPRGNDRVNQQVDLPNGDFVSYREFSYTYYDLAPTTVVLRGSATTLAVGGPALDAHLNGSIRLPLAAGNACDASLQCVAADDQSVRVAGNLSLLSLMPSAGGRLSGELSGHFQAVQLDSTPIHLAGPASIAAAVGVVALLGAAAKVFLGVLSTRTRGDPLQHPNRRALHDYILENPGATFRELVRGTGIPAGTARHHVAALLAGKLIQEHAHKSTLRYFENHGRFDTSWNTVVLRREPDLRRLHDWVLAHGGSAQGAVVGAAAEWGWSRSTTQHRLKRLVDEGLVEFREHGRLKRYWAREQAPVPVEDGRQGRSQVSAGHVA